jgi:enoyl-CoA hydratase/carnithine racemase
MLVSLQPGQVCGDGNTPVRIVFRTGLGQNAPTPVAMPRAPEITSWRQTMRGEVLLQRDGVVATIVLSHPERLNALSLAMWQGVAETIDKLNADESLRCVVLRGAGDRAFAAGADIAEFEHERCDSVRARPYGEAIDRGMQALRTSVHPTVAMIRGACVGGGLELAASCDLRICGESSRFGVPVKNLGLVMGLNELHGLITLVGRARALEIVLEGRVFGSDDAREMGLVNRVVPDAELERECAAMVERICEGAPLVARWHKAFANRLADPRPLDAVEISQNYACFDTEDFRIGYRAFLDKRKPRFEGR